MNTCSTCKHWQPNKLSPSDWMPNWEWLEEFGKCGFAIQIEKLVPGTVPTRNDFWSESDEPDVTTGPDFGCIHWEAK